MMIMSEQGYPENGEVLVRLDYYLDSPSDQGGILIVGKDSRGVEYKPKKSTAAEHSYVLPSGTIYTVPVGSLPENNHPAIYFPFRLNRKRWEPEIADGVLQAPSFDDGFSGKFYLTLMDESMKEITLESELEKRFKKITVWGAYELTGLLRNHFGGEMYIETTPALEEFLEIYRGE